MSGSRQAALTLHALPVAERSWVLERLEPGERRLMQSHLDELAALGIPPDPRLLEEAVGKVRAAAAPHAAISRAPAAVMRSLLVGEPAGVIARLLALGEWPWAEELMRELPLQRREKLRVLLSQAGRPRSQLDDWLLDELERRMHAALPERPEPAAPLAKLSWWARLRLRKGQG